MASSGTNNSFARTTSESFNDYNSHSQKNMSNYQSQMMGGGQSNGNMNSVKNDYFQYGGVGPQQNAPKGYRYPAESGGVMYPQQQASGFHSNNSSHGNYKMHHHENEHEVNTSGGDAHCSSTSGSVTSWNY